MKHYAITDISKLLNIPESTLRYYRDKFSQYIPYTGEGRKRRYPEQAVDVLRMIAEESNRNTHFDVIEERLRSKFTEFIEIIPDIAKEIATTAQHQNNVNLETIANISKVLEILVDKVNAIDTQNKIIAEQNKKIDLLISEIKELKESQLNAIEHKKTWWKVWK